MISWFAEFKNRFVKLEKIIEKTSRKSNAEIIEKSSKKPSKKEPKSTKNPSKMRAKKTMNFEKVPGEILSPPDLPKMITNQKITYR